MQFLSKGFILHRPWRIHVNYVQARVGGLTRSYEYNLVDYFWVVHKVYSLSFNAKCYLWFFRSWNWVLWCCLGKSPGLSVDGLFEGLARHHLVELWCCPQWGLNAICSLKKETGIGSEVDIVNGIIMYFWLLPCDDRLWATKNYQKAHMKTRREILLSD